MDVERKQSWLEKHNPNIPDAVIQWIGVAMSLFSLATACFTLGGVLQSSKFAWVVLILSVFGLIGPIAFLRDNLKWRAATCFFAFVVFVLSLMILMELLF
ncbi:MULTISPECIES: hypothetical protein [unclassified Rhizobium]|uniref:hypothetical protein n=1 Tax=unclassified Rhizobium TaxID=2613769 RepID=UPI0006F29F5D|nr:MULTISPECIES: hypothetical protein [unclassified Rhizobium]KQV39190.1 hypothetical protein ASC86_23265 [Rhizobium sp. Root1212]KRD35164.1 hypothetical protein ASE37_21835 [Rhizobium sp. Root268]